MSKPAEDTTGPIHSPQEHGFSQRMQRLARIPMRTRSLHHPRNWVAGARLFIDYILTVPPVANRVASKIRHYPAPFVKHRLRMRDGAALAAWLGEHEDSSRPTLIIIPGLFTSKDNAVVKRRALRIFHEWGYNVMALDLRGNGESDRVLPTVGWQEAQDLLEVVGWLRARPATGPVGIYAESLAATAAVLAAAEAGRRDQAFCELGVLAVSGFHDAKATVDLYNNPPRDKPQIREVVNFFNLILRAARYGAKTFEELHLAASRAYAVDPTEALAKADTATQLGRLRDPVLVLHSTDDTLVPVEQARRLEARAQDVANLGLWILPWGHHCLYEMAAPDWFWGVLRTFFEAPPDTA